MMQILTTFFSSGRRFHLCVCVCVCVCSPDREVAVTETVTFQILNEFERSKACVNAIE